MKNILTNAVVDGAAAQYIRRRQRGGQTPVALRAGNGAAGGQQHKSLLHGDCPFLSGDGLSIPRRARKENERTKIFKKI